METKSMMRIRRDEIPAIHSIEVDGKPYSLGVHMDFRRHPALRAFLPETARASFSWVKLEAGEELAAHTHPTASLILIASGRGESFGDLETTFEDGDVIVVPPGALHGFRGAAPAGYWALSVQLEGKGLYEDTNATRVAFAPPVSRAMANLVRLNESFMQAYLENPLFDYLEGEAISDGESRARLLDSIQVWSNFYQRMVRLRSVLSEPGKFASSAETHLVEEFQHNEHLARDRGPRPSLWDPTLEAGSSWFVWKMFTLDSTARAALVHLVLEGSSTVFHERADRVMARFQETKHFGVHHELDPDHLQQGYDLLQGLPEAKYAELEPVLREGWEMMNLICSRMAELATQKRAEAC